MKICSWRFFLEDLFWRFFHWTFENFLRRFVHGDFSFGIWFWRFFLWKMEIFPFEDLFVEIFPWRFILEIKLLKIFNEDLFMEIFPWRFILRYFSIEVLEIFIEDLFIGVFSFGIWFWRFFLWKMEIFPFEDLFVEIFPWKFILEIELLKKI